MKGKNITQLTKQQDKGKVVKKKLIHLHLIVMYRGSVHDVEYHKYEGLLKIHSTKAWSQPTTAVRLM